MTDIRRNIAILGSTGSIGTQTLDIVREHPERFRATVLTAHSNVQLLARQAREFSPAMVIIAREELEPELRSLLDGTGVEVASGADAIEQCVARRDVDIVVTAMVGYSGLAPTLNAIYHDKIIALSNKETLVVGGELITRKLAQSQARILPVDSEHSAIFQCLQGEAPESIDRIILTASGGPFRTLSAEQLEHVTVEQTLRHPNWDMGAKVTVDSASMMNKGFEMIEARWLFDCQPERIDVVVHPQSIVHSMVQFRDGSIKAQLGVPDMRGPIRYALGYPERLASSQPPLKLAQYANLTFEKPDYKKFPLLQMAFDVIEAGGTAPCILNAANEIAVAAFLRGELRFVDMPRLAEATLQALPASSDTDYNSLVETNKQARALASELLGKFRN